VIDECAPPGDERRRAEAVNETGGEENEKPLHAARRLRRWDLVGLLLEEGADASGVMGGDYRPTTALALCVCHDLPDTLRALLRKGHDANQRLVSFANDLPAASHRGRTLAHVCVGPPRLSPSTVPPPPRLACLEALVREGGARVDARDKNGCTPLHWAAHSENYRAAAAVDLLVRLGADVNARDAEGRTPIFECAEWGDIALLQQLLEHGASPDVFADNGFTPLVMACSNPAGVDNRDVTLELARRSSPETRRAVPRPHSYYVYSAVDCIVQGRDDLAPWQKELIADLLVSGVPVSPRHAA
jgi:ankyrin repeat protein